MALAEMEIEKKGRGSFRLIINDNGTVDVAINGGQLRNFSSARDAYENYRPFACDDHAIWNVCYHLEDFISDAGGA